MAYDYAQYQADRKLLLFRGLKALPYPEVLDMKLALALSRADAGDHDAIQAAHARLMAMMAEGLDAIPQPPEDAGEGVAGQGGPPDVPERPQERPSKVTRLTVVASSDPGQDYGPFETEAFWTAALDAQAERHARRRSHWPAVAPRRA